MGLVLRHMLVAFLPLLFGLGAGWAFALSQESCGRLVGFLFAAKCRGTQLEYQLAFQTVGTGVGCLLAASLGAWLEGRRWRGRTAPRVDA
jgi:hypothetical protein